MTKRQFVVLAFRLFALLLVIDLLTNIDHIFHWPSFLPKSMLLSYFVTATMVSAFLLIWFRSEWLMDLVFNVPSLSGVDPYDEDSDEPLVLESTSEQAAAGTSLLNDLPGETNLPEPSEYHEIAEQEETYFSETPLSTEFFELVLFRLVGLWAALTSLPPLFRSVYLAFTDPFDHVLSDMLTWSWLLQTGFGIWLFWQPWKFQAMIPNLNKERPKHSRNLI